jgi:hypothetical protein
MPRHTTVSCCQIKCVRVAFYSACPTFGFNQLYTTL